MITSIVIISATMVVAITVVIVWQCLNVINPQKDEWNQDYKPRLKLEIAKLEKTKRENKVILYLTKAVIRANKKEQMLNTIDLLINKKINIDTKKQIKKINKELMIARLKLWLKIK